MIQEILEECRRAKEGEIHVHFTDPTHLVYTTEVASCWQRKGKKNTKKISSNTGRRRLNVLGSINAITKQPVVVLTEQNCTSESIEMLLEEIRKTHPDGKEILLYLDNAPYHHAYEIEELAEELNITLRFLPPYSPNLNIIERLWKLLKKTVKYNKYYDTYNHFEHAVELFFKGIDKHSEKLHTLLTLKFQIIS